MYVQAQQHRQCRAGDRHRVRDLRQHPQRGGAAGISQKVHCAVKVCTLMRGSAATSMRGVTASTKSWPRPMHRYDRRCGELVGRQTRRVVDVLRVQWVVAARLSGGGLHMDRPSQRCLCHNQRTHRYTYTNSKKGEGQAWEQRPQREGKYLQECPQ